MDLLLFSTDDEASMNIFENFKKLTNIEKIGTFGKNFYYQYENFYLIIIEKEKVFAENIDREIKDTLKINFDNIIVASKHRSESGIKTLTVHPIGNFGNAELGGKPKTVVPVPANLMTGALLKLYELGKNTGYSISYEATHHGPYLETPTFFIEIGSNLEEWKNPEMGEIISKTILSMKKTDDDIAIGIGGGHYTPRFTKIALTKKISFGHMVPKYHSDKIDSKMLYEIVLKSNAKYLIMEKKDLSSKERKRIEDILDSVHLELIDPDSLPDRD